MSDRKGVVLILTFIVMVTLAAITAAFLYMTSIQVRASGRSLADARAFQVAQAGVAKARWALSRGGQSPGWGETASPFGAGQGTYVVTTAYSDWPTRRHVTITSSGYIPGNSNFIARRQVVESVVPLRNNLSLSATASASSVRGSSTPDRAIDGSRTTRWQSNIRNGSWLKLDFGSPLTFDRVIYYSLGITSYSIDYSNDNLVWQAVVNPVESPARTVNFNPVSARYLRFNVHGDRPSVMELETYNTAQPLGKGEFTTLW
jgi:hypothetical protein